MRHQFRPGANVVIMKNGSPGSESYYLRISSPMKTDIPLGSCRKRLDTVQVLAEAEGLLRRIDREGADILAERREAKRQARIESTKRKLEAQERLAAFRNGKLVLDTEDIPRLVGRIFDSQHPLRQSNGKISSIHQVWGIGVTNVIAGKHVKELNQADIDSSLRRVLDYGVCLSSIIRLRAALKKVELYGLKKHLRKDSPELDFSEWNRVIKEKEKIAAEEKLKEKKKLKIKSDLDRYLTRKERTAF